MQIEKNIVELLLDDILPNRLQPRIKFDEQAITELSESIKEHGVIQPIIVRRLGDKYEIIAGERRYKASVMAGRTTIPAILANLDDKQSAEIALIENIQRKDLTPIEEAISYQRILDMGYLTQEQLAEKVDKSQPSIANKLRLLKLPDAIQQALLDNAISERHARSLLRLKTEEQQVTLLQRIINERLTVRKTDEEIVNILNEDGNNSGDPNIKSPEIIEKLDLEEAVNMNENDNSNNPITNFNMPVEPIIEAEPIFNDVQQNSQINPGFMDVEKIENEAQDIHVEKASPDIEKLLQNENEPTVVEEIKPADTIIEQPQPQKQGRFFNNLEDEQVNMNFEEPAIEPVATPNPVGDGVLDMYNSPEPIIPEQNIDKLPEIDNNSEPLAMEIPVTLDTPAPIDIPVTLETPQEVEAPVPTSEPELAPMPETSVVTEAPLFVEPEQPVSIDNPVIEPVTPEPLFETNIPTPTSESLVMEEVVTPPEPVVEPAPEEIKDVFSEPLDIPEINIMESSFASPEPNSNLNPVSPSIDTPVNPYDITPTPRTYESIIDPNINMAPVSSAPKIITAINSIRDVTANLERMGFYLDVEELDLEDLYQVIIKISKD